MKFAFRASVVARAADGSVVIALIGEKPTDVHIAVAWPSAAEALHAALGSELEIAMESDDDDFFDEPEQPD